MNASRNYDISAETGGPDSPLLLSTNPNVAYPVLPSTSPEETGNSSTMAFRNYGTSDEKEGNKEHRDSLVPKDKHRSEHA
jgi:hypothetical protein